MNTLLEKMFSDSILEDARLKAESKGIKSEVIEEFFSDPEAVKTKIESGRYKIMPPHIAKIPKDNPGEFREVYVNEPMDRIVLSIINDCLFDLFPEMIHPNCRSYQKGIGTQDTVRRVVREVKHLDLKGMYQIGWKTDFSKYFDTVGIEHIDRTFDTIEDKLGYARNTEPVMNLLRAYYHSDVYYDLKRNLMHKYQSLKQGCAVASFLACAILYDLDEFMTNKYSVYYRYSDDICVIDKTYFGAVEDINRFIAPYGMKLNPKKVEPIYVNQWFKFLGFNINGDKITLSKSRVLRLEDELRKRSIDLQKCTLNRARKNIQCYLFSGQYCWASTCLATINVEKDINEINKYILDCIRACKTGKKDIGHLRVDMTNPNSTIVRTKGRNVRSNRDKVGQINDYLPLQCMQNDYVYHRSVFDAVVRNMLA